jgi:regulatory protein
LGRYNGRFSLEFGLWHKSGVMEPTRRRRALPPLDEGRLNELALRYVGRFATTRAKLRSYLGRKVRERGWDGPQDPDFGAIADRFAELGYVNDSAYALAKSQSLTSRGYGKRRVVESLRAAGVEEDETTDARQHADEEAVTAALRYAKRKRIGPFAAERATDPSQRQKALAAMVRAGHGFDLAKTIVAIAPEQEPDFDQLMRLVQLTVR